MSQIIVFVRTKEHMYFAYDDDLNKYLGNWFHLSLSLSVKSNKMELLSLQHQLQILPEHHFKLKLLPYIYTYILCNFTLCSLYMW